MILFNNKIQLILMLAFFYKINYAQSYREDSIKCEYLSKKSVVFNPKKDTFPIKTDENYRIYLFGEAHSQNKSTNSFISLTKTLFLKDSSFALMLEFGPSQEYLMQKYVKEKKRRIIFCNKAYSIISKSEERRYFKPLANVILSNSGLPEDAMHAVDVERDFGIALLTLGVILESNKSNLNLKLLKQIDFIDHAIKESSNLFNRKCRIIIRDFYGDSLLYSKQLQTNSYNQYRDIINALDIGVTCDSLEHTGNINDFQKAYQIREDYILSRILFLMNLHPRKKLVGQFGMTHIVTEQMKWYKLIKWVSMGERLARYFPNQVCRIVNFYEGKKHASVNRAILPLDDQRLFLAISHKRKITVFKMQPTDIFQTQYDYILINR